MRRVSGSIALRAYVALARAGCAVAAFAVAGCVLAGCGPGVVWLGKSPDRRRDVVVLQEGGAQRVRVDGRDGAAFLGIGIESLAWSPDSRRLAYPARVASGWAVVVDGVAGPAFTGVGEIAWSADSRRVAYAAEQRGRWVVVRDGVAGASFEALRRRSLRFSDDGAHLGYVAEDGGKVIAVIDEARSAPYDAIGHLVFGADGKAAFVARRGAEARIVAGGKEGEAYEDVADLAMSPDGKRLAWTARKRDGWHVIEDGSESAAFERVSLLVWSPRSSALAFAVGRGGAEHVVVRGAMGAPYEGVLPGSVTFDASGEHVAYAARRRGAWRVIVDEVESPPFDEVEAPIFVGDSSAVAHVARRGEASFVVVDERFGPVCADASELVVSRDGRRFVHTARIGPRTAVIEGEITGGPCGGGRCAPVMTGATVYDAILGGTLALSDDGRHRGYIAGGAEDRELYLVIDGKRAGTLDMNELMAGLALEPDLAGALTGDSKRLSQWVRAEVALRGQGAAKAPRGSTK